MIQNKRHIFQNHLIYQLQTVQMKCCRSQLFKSFEFGNESRMSDENLVILEFGRNKL